MNSICPKSSKLTVSIQCQGCGSRADPDRYSILYTHLQTIRYDTIQFIILSNRYDTILYEYDPNLRAKHYFRLKCFRLSEAHWPHGTLRIILPQFFRLNMILHIVRILPPQKLCNNSPRRTFSSPPESNFGHRGPSELTRAPVQLERPHGIEYTPIHHHHIGIVSDQLLSQLPPVSYRIRSIGIEYSPNPIRSLVQCGNRKGLDRIQTDTAYFTHTFKRYDTIRYSSLFYLTDTIRYFTNTIRISDKTCKRAAFSRPKGCNSRKRVVQTKIKAICSTTVMEYTCMQTCRSQPDKSLD